MQPSNPNDSNNNLRPNQSNQYPQVDGFSNINNPNTYPNRNSPAQPASSNLDSRLFKVRGPSSIKPMADPEANRGSSGDSKKDERKSLIYTIALFILAPAFAIFMIVFVFQSYVVSGSSMEPTLQNNNRVFILKLPKTVASLQNKQFIPARNEVIVFNKPSYGEEQLIKRVIGLPGEIVTIKDSTVTVFNKERPDGFDPQAGNDYANKVEKLDTGGETLEFEVGPGELFVLGDNRTPGGSLDSHSGLGNVPLENIVGRLWIRYFPISSFEVYAKIKQLDNILLLETLKY